MCPPGDIYKRLKFLLFSFVLGVIGIMHDMTAV